ncbi:unnamed protein product [Prorocentrum cordatum]|uniref:Uncharacterized protein n=1 Tax=Prorocentrum cordatum TaxID=2364126 RepID=A0ABN9RUL6_9DINO|nr:unnamed protein product [Polarella glacialis]
MWAPARARHWFGPREVASGAVGPMGTKTLCPPLAMTGPPPPGGGCADGLRDPMDAAAGAHARARPQPLPDGGQGKAGQKEDEDTLLDGAVQLAHVQQRAERTRGKLMAVLHYHVAVGYPDPLELAPRLWLNWSGWPPKWTSEGDLPLFRDEERNPIGGQEETKGLLDQAATAVGIHPSHIGSHSLWIGGPRRCNTPSRTGGAKGLGVEDQRRPRPPLGDAQASEGAC